MFAQAKRAGRLEQFHLFHLDFPKLWERGHRDKPERQRERALGSFDRADRPNKDQFTLFDEAELERLLADLDSSELGNSEPSRFPRQGVWAARNGGRTEIVNAVEY